MAGTQERTIGSNQKVDRPSDSNAPLTKMTSGGEELRDHDFPVAAEQAGGSAGAVAVNTHAPPPEAVRSGGRNGTVPGDTQRFGEVGTIMNQDASDPDNFADR